MYSRPCQRTLSHLLAVIVMSLMAPTARAQDRGCAPGSECWAMVQTQEAINRQAAGVAVLSTKAHEAQQSLEKEAEALRDFIERFPIERQPGGDSLQIDRLILAIERLAEKSATESVKHDPYSQVTGRTGRQLDPRDDMRRYYGVAAGTHYYSIVVAVPDPRVPRLRRVYDLTVDALIRGAAANDFDFDRYSAPWAQDQPPGLGIPDPQQLAMLALCEAEETQSALLQQPHPNRDYCRGRQSLKELCKPDQEQNTQATPGGSALLQPCAIAAEAKQCDARQRARAEPSRCPPPPDTVSSATEDFALLTFRRDAWRRDDSPGTELEVLALYLVADRPSSGIDPGALTQALLRSAAQSNGLAAFQRRVSGTAAPIAQLSGPSSCRLSRDSFEAVSWSGLSLIGPSFSGSFSSLRVPLKSIRAYLRDDVFLRSPVASAATNCKAVNFHGLRMSNTPALDDRLKMAGLNGYLKSLGLSESEKRALIAENSTWAKEFADSPSATPPPIPYALTLRVPPNMWEVEIDPGGKPGDQSRSDYAKLLSMRREMRLDADVGSEFPAPYSQQVSARVQELAVDASIRSLRQSSVVQIAATDTRDQLYWARRVRSVNTGALLVFPEADQLLAHPDYLDATRGSLVLSHWPLSINWKDPRQDLLEISRQDFAKDDASGYFHVLGDTLDDIQPSKRWQTANPEIHFYVVGRNGLVQLATKKPGSLTPTVCACLLILLVIVLTAAITAFRSRWIGMQQRMAQNGNQLRAFLYAFLGTGVAATLAICLMLTRDFFAKKSLALLISGLLAIALIIWVVHVYGRLRGAVLAHSGNQPYPVAWLVLGVVVLFIPATLIHIGVAHLGSVCSTPHECGPGSGLNPLFALWAAFLGLAAYVTVDRHVVLMQQSTRPWLGWDAMTVWPDVWRWNSPHCLMLAVTVGGALSGTLCYSRYTHPLGNGATIAAKLACVILLICLVMNMASLLLWTLRRQKLSAKLEGGQEGIPFDAKWVGGSEFQRYATPFAAWPDLMRSTPLGIAPALGELRRCRQVLGTVIAAQRHHGALGMLLPLLTVASIYFTPMPLQTTILGIALLTMVLAAVLTWFNVMTLEKSELASMAFCRQNSSIQFGSQLLAYLVAPVVMLALVLWLTLLPGMREWTEDAALPIIGRLIGV
jgi:hypothetical protein